jgi:hypothetical protein
VEGVIVMLYDQLQDSIPYLQIPLYATRTGKDGRFRLNNLRADTFLVFALKDENNNYLYDRPGEEAIAFLDDHISPEHPITLIPIIPILITRILITLTMIIRILIIRILITRTMITLIPGIPTPIIFSLKILPPCTIMTMHTRTIR